MAPAQHFIALDAKAHSYLDYKTALIPARVMLKPSITIFHNEVDFESLHRKWNEY